MILIFFLKNLHDAKFSSATVKARGVHNMLRVRVCAAHMGGSLG